MTDYCDYCHQKRPCGCDTLFDSVSEPKAEPSIWPGLDHIANYINSLDTEGMSGLEVRKAIYRQCIQPGKPTRGDAELVERVKVLEEVVGQFLRRLETSRQNWTQSAADRAGLVAEVERLREALLWYERQASDYRKITTEGDDARYALQRDGGALARAALKDTRND